VSEGHLRYEKRSEDQAGVNAMLCEKTACIADKGEKSREITGGKISVADADAMPMMH